MELYIAEKPDIAKDIARVLANGSQTERKDGYFVIGQKVVSWCYGHVLEMIPPKDINPEYEKWSLETLPLKLYPLQLQPKKTAEKQVNTLLSLIKKADKIYNACDPDDEGQLIFDELITYSKIKKPLYRILINDNTDESIIKAIENNRPNDEFKGLSAKALARTLSDAIYGLSMTRACTVIANHKKPLSIGRVQTPVFAMIAKRFLDKKQHKKTMYYELDATFENKIKAKYKLKDDAPVDDKKRVTTKSYLDNILTKVVGKTGVITEIKIEDKETLPPLPFNLIKLQQEMNNKYGYTASQTLEITQKLREKHKAITYNRSDCSYLSDEQYQQAPSIINAVMKNNEFNTTPDLSLKSSAFDNSKITAHTAIIPTSKEVDIKELTKDEKNVYIAICERFIVQFLPPKKYASVSVTVTVLDETFHLKQQMTTDKGFTHFLASDENQEQEQEQEQDNNDAFNYLINLNNDDKIQLSFATVIEKETKPKPLFTESSLLASLVRVADFVDDPKIKKLLKSKDKDKKDEHGGIGTPATRHSIIELLKTRNFIELQKKELVPTQIGLDFYNMLPTELLSVDLTALMFEQQEQIEKEQLTIEEFINQLYIKVTNLIELVRNSELSKLKPRGDFDFNCRYCDGQLKNSDKVIKCTSCGFILWKTISKKNLTDSNIKILITKGITQTIKGFTSKNDKPFDAKLKLSDSKKIEFIFEDKKK